MGERETRQDRHLRPPSTRTAAGQGSFAYRAAAPLNLMPDDTRELGLTAFRRAAIEFFRTGWRALVSLCVRWEGRGGGCYCDCVRVCVWVRACMRFIMTLWPNCFILWLMARNSHDYTVELPAMLIQYNKLTGNNVEWFGKMWYNII